MDQLDRPEHAEPVYLADRRVARRHLLEPRSDHILSEVAGVLDDALLLEDADAGDGGGARQRMPRIGQAAGVRPVGERVGDAAADDDAAEWDVTGVDALGEADQIRGDAPVVDGEPLAAAPEARHDLIGDHHDAVAIAQLATPCR